MLGAMVNEVSDAARRLKALREQAGLPMRAVADHLGWTLTRYQHYEDRFRRRYLPQAPNVSKMDEAPKGKPPLVYWLGAKGEDYLETLGVPFIAPPQAATEANNPHTKMRHIAPCICSSWKASRLSIVIDRNTGRGHAPA